MDEDAVHFESNAQVAEPGQGPGPGSVLQTWFCHSQLLYWLSQSQTNKSGFKMLGEHSAALINSNDQHLRDEHLKIVIFDLFTCSFAPSWNDASKTNKREEEEEAAR